MQAVQKLPPLKRPFRSERTMIPLPELFEGAMLAIVSKYQASAAREVVSRWLKFTEPLNLRFCRIGSPKDYGKMAYVGSFVFMMKGQLWFLLQGTPTSAGSNKQYACDIVAFKLNPMEISIHHDNASLEKKIFEVLCDKPSLFNTLIVGDRYGAILCPSISRYATSRVPGLVQQAVDTIDEGRPMLDRTKILRGNNEPTTYTRESQVPLGELILTALHTLS